MKKLLLSVLSLLMVTFAMNAQTFYSEDFSSGVLTDFTVYDYDATPASASITNGVTSEWTAIGGVAAVTSWTDPVVATDDWLITPQISIGTGSNLVLSFTALSLGNTSFLDRMEVLISTTTTDSSSFSTIIAEYEVPNNTLGDGSMTFDMASYAGMNVYIAFRSLGFDDYILTVDDIKVENVMAYNVANTGISNFTYGYTTSPIDVSFTNNGLETVTSVDISYVVDGMTYTETVTDLSVASGEDGTASVTNPVTAEGEYADITAEITAVNGNPDGDATDNTSDASTLVFQEDTDAQNMFYEEATGTWCQWCPRGDVFLNQMKEDYPNTFIGIAVHNNDPMANATYDGALSSMVQGYPSGILQRGFELDPSALPDVYDIVTAWAAPFSITHTAAESAGTITVDVSAEALVTMSGDFNINAVITEDGVTGTADGYAQVNAYAGGASGEMGGYENLPNPVPAADMVYNHVARELLSGAFEGEALASAPTAADSYTKTYTYTVPADQMAENMHAVVFITDANGLVVASQSVSVTTSSVGLEDVSSVGGVKLLNNPSVGGISYISLELDESMPINVEIFDLMGKQVTTRNYGQLDGNQVLPINTQNFASGTYFVSVSSGAEKVVKKLIVK